MKMAMFCVSLTNVVQALRFKQTVNHFLVVNFSGDDSICNHKLFLSHFKMRFALPDLDKILTNLKLPLKLQNHEIT